MPLQRWKKSQSDRGTRGASAGSRGEHVSELTQHVFSAWARRGGPHEALVETTAGRTTRVPLRRRELWKKRNARVRYERAGVKIRDECIW